MKNSQGAEYIGDLLGFNPSGDLFINVERIKLGEHWEVIKPEIQKISNAELVKE